MQEIIDIIVIFLLCYLIFWLFMLFLISVGVLIFRKKVKFFNSMNGVLGFRSFYILPVIAITFHKWNDKGIYIGWFNWIVFINFGRKRNDK